MDAMSRHWSSNEEDEDGGLAGRRTTFLMVAGDLITNGGDQVGQG